MLAPFHLAIPVRDLDETRSFYRDVLGCAEGRSSDLWVDFNFFGHQLVIHMSGEANTNLESNAVDGHDVPIPHFGIVLTWDRLDELIRGFDESRDRVYYRTLH